MLAKDASRSGDRVDGSATVVVAAMDGHPAQDVGGSPKANHGEKRGPCSPILQRRAPDHAAHETVGMFDIGQHLQEQGVSAAGAKIIMASWKTGTRKQYQPHIRRWLLFCNRWNINPYNPTVHDIINFLSENFHRNVGYESINTTRSALSSIGIVVDGCSAGNHPLVVRFMKGVFNLRPPLPRYTETWDVQPVLQELRAMYPLHTLTLKDLTLKLVMLMALTQAARVQTLHLLTIRGMVTEQDSILVQLSDNIKQCRRQFNIRTIKFQAYSTDTSLCVCKTLQHYLERTEEIRHGTSQETNALLISFIKPHKAVTKDTIARWIKTMLRRAGVDTTKFTAGSVRPAAASKAKTMAVPINYILAKAGWSRESTFAKYYDKHIIGPGDPFQEAVLG